MKINPKRPLNLVKALSLKSTQSSHLEHPSQPLIEAKETTQKAPLERLLTHLRTRKIVPYVEAKVVLDFGCGRHLTTLRALYGRAKARYGIDSAFVKTKSHKTSDGIGVVGSFEDLRAMLKTDNESIQCILSLACFEHLEPESCRQVLRELATIVAKDAFLVGTAPTPPAKPVLEFLSYRLGLIDRSQIEDHKIYYDQKTLSDMISGTGWEMVEYRRFQLGMNSFFRLGRLPH